MAALAPLGADYVAGLRGVRRALDRLLPDRREALGRLLERRRLRRAPVHAAQLQRPVHGHVHAGARARPHDAQLLLEQDAAVPPRRTTRSSWPRSPRRSTRRCYRPHAEARSPTEDAKLSLLGNYLEKSRARCSARRSSPSSSCGCTRWRRRASRSPATRSSKLYLDITRKYYGHDAGVCVVDDYVANEWAFISALLHARSTSSSTRRRSRPRPRSRRKCWRAIRRPRALPDVPRVRRFEVSDRSAEGRRRRHDHRRAARPDDAEDERVMDEIEKLIK